jgi:hypothetical protein
MADSGIKDCGRCGEDACLISFDGKHFVRVRRSSKCKKYKPNHCERSCKTEVLRTSAEAVAAWNDTKGAELPEPPKPPRPDEFFKAVGGPC